jgi:uncharacterized caspase-like protein
VKSTIVLVGVSSYNQANGPGSFESIAQIDRNLEICALTLPGSLITEQPAEVIMLRNPTSSDGMAGAIATAAASATDTLLFYYAGHGIVTANGGLALTHSNTSRAFADYQALDFDRVRAMIRESKAQRKIVIVDCCFSGAALGQTLDMKDFRGQMQLRGSYVMTSSPATRPSHVFEHESMTAFTERLINAIQAGSKNGVSTWSFNQLFLELRQRMIDDGLPEPQALDNNALGDQQLIRRIKVEQSRAN